MNMPLIPPHQLSEKNRFPIVGQLVVLSLILAMTFGSLWWFSPNRTEPITENGRPTIDLADVPVTASLMDIPPVTIRAESAYVWDVRSQKTLYQKNETGVLPLASITKLMTALVAHELVNESTNVTLPADAIKQEGNSGLLFGETLTIDELNQLALVSSSNDAAFAIADSAGALLGERDSAQQFIAAMNVTADELKLPTLEFLNTTGLDIDPVTPGATGNAREVSLLLEHILLTYPELVAITTEPNLRVFNTDGVFHDAENTNVITNQIPNLLASKTGYTDLAGGNLTVAFDLGLDRPIIITVLGSTRDARFTDVLTLVEAVQAAVATN